MLVFLRARGDFTPPLPFVVKAWEELAAEDGDRPQNESGNPSVSSFCKVG